MERKYNSQAFTPEEVKKGLLKDLLDYLLEHNRKNEEQYYDIHITTDGYCSIVEWTDVMYNQEYGPDAKFQFVDTDEVVMKEVCFPDNHYEYLFEDEIDERFKEWLKDNPGWEKTTYGTWTNRIENRFFYLDCHKKELIDAPIEDTYQMNIEGVSKEDRVKQLLEMFNNESFLSNTDYLVIGSEVEDYFRDCIEDARVVEAGTTFFCLGDLNKNEKNPITVYVLEDLGSEVCAMSRDNIILKKVKCIL